MARRAGNRTVGGQALLLRLGPVLRAAAEEAARVAEMSLAEWVREAMQARLRREARKNSAPTHSPG